MSRAYRLSVRESCHRVLKGSDHIATQLEILDILPREVLGTMLAEELRARGYEEQEGKLTRQDGQTRITVDPTTGEVRVEAELSSNEQIEVTRTGNYFDETPQAHREKLKENLQKQAQEELDVKADARTEELTRRATELLEQSLRDVQGELNEVVNRVTAEALKQKAAQLGEIKEITEDSQSGALTIVLEV